MMNLYACLLIPPDTSLSRYKRMNPCSMNPNKNDTNPVNQCIEPPRPPITCTASADSHRTPSTLSSFQAYRFRATYLIDLVHHVQCWHVLAISLDDIDELIDSAVLSQHHVTAVQPVFSEHRQNKVVRQLRLKQQTRLFVQSMGGGRGGRVSGWPARVHAAFMSLQQAYYVEVYMADESDPASRRSRILRLTQSPCRSETRLVKHAILSNRTVTRFLQSRADIRCLDSLFYK